jgi:hypothetical protein
MILVMRCTITNGVVVLWCLGVCVCVVAQPCVGVMHVVVPGSTLAAAPV